MSVWLALASVASYAGLPAGEMIEDAVMLDVPVMGFELAGDIAAAAVPARIEVPCIEEPAEGWCLLDMAFTLDNVWVDLVDPVVVANPTNAGVIDLMVTALVSVNHANDRFVLDGEFACIDMICEGWVDPFELDLTSSLTPSLDAATGAISIDIGEFEASWPGDVEVTMLETWDCLVEDVEDILNLVGTSIFDIMMDEASETIETLDEDLEAALIPVVEGLLVPLELPLDDTEDRMLTLDFLVSELFVDDDGLRLGLDVGSSLNDVDPCIAAFDTGESVDSLL